jgi:hypothetical protein
MIMISFCIYRGNYGRLRHFASTQIIRRLPQGDGKRMTPLSNQHRNDKEAWETAAGMPTCWNNIPFQFYDAPTAGGFTRNSQTDVFNSASATVTIEQ